MDPHDRLVGLPRAALGTWPTPLHRLTRFGDAIGAEVWIKRDDIGSVGLAGNKVRKFELVLGRALADGADTLVTVGALQSNSARCGAVAAASLGMDAVLLLTGDDPGRSTGNVLIDRLVGADVRFVGDLSWAALNELVQSTMAEISATGRHPVSAPVGCSSPLGALGFALAYDELDHQLRDIDLEPQLLVHTSTSGGTHAGLLAGRALGDRAIGIVGMDAASMYRDAAATCAELANEALGYIGAAASVSSGDATIESVVGPGYAVPSPEGLAAIELLARTEGILVDPVYSAKGLGGLIVRVRRGVEGPVVFWHTGGYHSLFEPEYGDAALSR